MYMPLAININIFLYVYMYFLIEITKFPVKRVWTLKRPRHVALESLGHEQKWGELIPVNGIPTLTLFIIGVSEWLLVNANSAIFQLYHGENKLIFNEMMMRSALY